ncbi:FAD-binding oxidoreductase [Telmatocola sphagniphila]|uniref:FAD-binding oxidoreductase n=1 Tax=Telmatocola sphagniphila TaxID=1123043 RepID=A0A8E6ETE6_9BACT|nr:FAD-dependent oxidoreductase [Telmatocola sphagniphila]QVL29827.1 FAD-binding oxidoreductase [Telmatocola sphagniphila]
MDHFDYLILGQGLAGSTLAWQLIWRGKSVCVVDPVDEVTSSKIAAGLLTPLTGKRLVKTEGWDDYWPLAKHFYQQVERFTQASILTLAPMVRIFTEQKELQRFEAQLQVEPHLLRSDPSSTLDPNDFEQPHGSFEMPVAGVLNCPEYLQATRDYLRSQQRFLTDRLDLSEDIELLRDRVYVPRWKLTACQLISCTGHQERRNPRLLADWLPAKGEILTLRIPGLQETRVVHRGIWLARCGNEIYRAGSTYEWKELDSAPTQAGRELILKRLKEFLKRDFEIVDHRAAIRPILRDLKPAIGLAPDLPQLGFFNGLGTKGALYAPLVSLHFANFLIDATPIPTQLSWTRFGSAH